MEAQEQENMTNLLNEQLQKDLADADSSFEMKMIQGEYDKKLEKLNEGQNIFEDNSPDDSHYECIGCGA
jgi:hypothetical protein